ncbi:NACHT domain-containing protein [Streptomyces sp. NPDC004244]|uniref:NACHT domain-containing protein n=1 Tax=Streptomyces sp. NPDC101206 TaxID=3366128 RepID=UPI003821E73F
MLMIGGRGYRRWRVWLAVVGGLLVAASALYAAAQLTHGDLGPSDTVGLIGLPLGVAALVVALAGPRRPPAGDQAQLARGWAATLAEQVKQDQQRQWRQMIGDDTQRINLSFTLRPEPGRDATAPAGAGRLFEECSPFPDVAEYYRRTCPRRLVVTGEPGAGKTVLALELMLALLDERGEGDPVPVRLSLAEWDPAIPLQNWLARHLMDVYDWPAQMAGELVSQCRVLPVLDGLDEMDPTAPGGAPSPAAPRARAALESLNAYQDGRAAAPVILTCRTRHYQALGGRVRLLDAACIDIDPVTTPAACAYLRQRAWDPARWRPVLEALEGDPAGTLATALSTPWRLTLVATTYARDGDPADLLRHATASDLDEHLLARFVPAATALHPRSGRPYSAGDVHSWLAILAAHLGTSSSASGEAAGAGTGARTDLVLHQLWPLAGSGRVRAADAVLTALVVLLPLPLAWVSTNGGLLIMPVVAAVVAGCHAARASLDPPARVRWGRLRTKAGWRDLATGLAVGLGLGLAAGLAFWITFWLGTEPALGLAFGLEAGLTIGLALGLALGLASGLTRAIGREPSTTTRPRDVIRSDLLRGLAVGLTFGTVFWIAAGLLYGFFYGLMVGLFYGLVAGLAVVFTRAIGPVPSTTARPRDVIRSDLLRGLTAGVAAALAAGLALGFLAGFSLGPAAGLAAGPGYGVAVGLMVGVGFGAPSGRRYLVFLLCSRGKLPGRLGVFLDWACAAGLLRFAGAAYQFRHRELQQWLARHPVTPPV